MQIDNPAFDYDRLGHSYAGYRQTDPHIAAFVNRALGGAQTILNVGAGAGSYEPSDRYIVAVEPSSVMRAQRIAKGKVPAINAKAELLPFDDNTFDAAMAMLTVHHWPNLEKGLREVRRVTRGQIVIMTYDPAALDVFWNVRYFPELIDVERARYPAIDRIQQALGGSGEVVPVSIPLQCVDGFQEAFYGRPEAFLHREVRKAQSAWGFLAPGLEDELVERLSEALLSGAWDREFGHYRKAPSK
ncbi:MAG: class I SAM-dependent methyltransferase [Saprospiraceae bacterium]|nr:class I SAM-dependent methyltransferase [Saprospiraceae bacterium]